MPTAAGARALPAGIVSGGGGHLPRLPRGWLLSPPARPAGSGSGTQPGPRGPGGRHRLVGGSTTWPLPPLLGPLAISPHVCHVPSCTGPHPACRVRTLPHRGHTAGSSPARTWGQNPLGVHLVTFLHVVLQKSHPAEDLWEPSALPSFQKGKGPPRPCRSGGILSDVSLKCSDRLDIPSAYCACTRAQVTGFSEPKQLM